MSRAKTDKRIHKTAISVFKVIQQIIIIAFGVNRKYTYEFLLVIKSKLGLSRTISEIWQFIS